MWRHLVIDLNWHLKKSIKLKNMLGFFWAHTLFIHPDRNITQQKKKSFRRYDSCIIPNPTWLHSSVPPRVMWPLALPQISWRRGTQHTQWGPFTSSRGLALSSKQRSQCSRRSLYFSFSLKCFFSPSRLCSSPSGLLVLSSRHQQPPPPWRRDERAVYLWELKEGWEL